MSEAVGRATITANQGECLYSVEADYGLTEVNQRIALLQATIAKLAAARDELDGQIATAESERISAQLSLDSAIAALSSEEPDNRDTQSVDEATHKVLQALASMQVLQSKRGRAVVGIANAEYQIGALQALDLTQSKSAWCCDYTDDATGQVATVEINGEQPQLLVAPGAPSPDGTEGLMTHRLAMSPAATFLNAAILPGWQKFSPTYRVGEITDLNLSEDKCDVTLDAAASSAQGLGINQSLNMSGVPIQYMTCDAEVFEVGDKVVVRFDNQDWEQPTVIGFENNPRPCEFDLWVSANVEDSVSGVRQRVTARLKDDLTVINTWAWSARSFVADVARIDNQSAAVVSAGSSTGARLDVRDATSGSLLFQTSWSYDSTANGVIGLSIDKPLSALYLGGDRGIEHYTWPDGAFVKSIPDPGGIYASSIKGRGETLFFAVNISFDGFSAGHMYVRCLNTSDFSQRWERLIGTPGEAFDPIDVALSPDYAATLTEFGDTGPQIQIFDPTDGTTIRTISVSGDAQGISIRGDKMYMLEYVRAPQATHNVIVFDILTGSPASPDGRVNDLFGAYTTTDDLSTGDFGSID